MQVARVDVQLAGGARPVAAVPGEGGLDALALAFIHGGTQGAGQGGWFCGGRLQRCGCGWRPWRGCGWAQRIQVQQRGFERDDGVAVGAMAQGLECGAADDMLQLADVARPVVAAQGVLCAGRQAQAANAQPCAVEFEKAPRQQQHVVAALAQRRYWHRVDRQAVVQVGAERAIGHQVAQAAVGGGDHAHVHAPGLVGAQALDFAVLQGAQQLGLHGQRQLAHFVKEQGAAVGCLEAARAVAHGARKRTAAVAEQLALGQ